MNKLLCAALVALMFATGSVMAEEEDFGLLIFNHRIAIGMTYGNVQAAWGKPDKVDRSVRNSGVREFWFFSNGCMVVFDKGRVSSIED